MKNKSILCSLICILMSFSTAKASMVDFLAAMRYVEASSHLAASDGDNGAAIGVYQIHEEYWYDATHNSRGEQIIDGSYEDCRDKDYAEKIIFAYWGRYAKIALKNNDYETLAKIHNGGPHGNRKRATTDYWIKIRKALNQ